MPLTRRALLASAAGTVLALSGCSGGGSSATPTASVHEVFVVNATPNPRTVDLQILDGDELVFWQSVSVPVSDPDAEMVTGVQTVSEIPDAAGRYAMRARLTDSPEWREADFTDVSVPDEACFRVEIRIDDSDTLSFLHTVDEAACRGTAIGDGPTEPSGSD